LTLTPSTETKQDLNEHVFDSHDAS